MEEDSDKAIALIASAVDAGEPIVAPVLLLMEFTNVVRQHMRREGLSLEGAENAMNQLRRWSRAMEIVTPSELSAHLDALTTASRYSLSAAYDAYYITLAEHLQCDFWTADTRLLNALQGRLSFVHALNSFVS